MVGDDTTKTIAVMQSITLITTCYPRTFFNLNLSYVSDSSANLKPSGQLDYNKLCVVI